MSVGVIPKLLLQHSTGLIATKLLLARALATPVKVSGLITYNFVLKQ